MKLLKRLIIFAFILIVIVYILRKTNLKKVVIEAIYPTKYSEYVEKYSEEYEIDKLLIYSIIKAESNFDPNVKSKSEAIGLMQLMKSTAKEIKPDITEEELYNEEVNIKIGIEYFNKLLNHYDGNINLSIIAYNAGMGNVDKWINEGTIKNDGSDIENVPFKETNNYVRKILRDYTIYKEIYN